MADNHYPTERPRLRRAAGGIAQRLITLQVVGRLHFWKIHSLSGRKLVWARSPVHVGIDQAGQENFIEESEMDVRISRMLSIG
jgi:hypothetical protein